MFHVLNLDYVRVPTCDERAYRPPLIYIAMSCYHCDASDIRPLTDYYLRLPFHVGIVPLQSAPNTYHILASLRNMFKAEFAREQTVDEIIFLYKVKASSKNPYLFLRSKQGFQTAICYAINVHVERVIATSRSNSLDHEPVWITRSRTHASLQVTIIEVRSKSFDCNFSAMLRLKYVRRVSIGQVGDVSIERF